MRFGVGGVDEQAQIFSPLPSGSKFATSLFIFHCAANTSVPELDEWILSGRMIQTAIN